jgi:hypothetical protein
MKNITLFTLLLISIFSCQSKAQQTIDTLNYVKQFEINKIDYVNKPFSYLLSHMTQIQPKTVNSLPQVWGKDLTPESIFDFTEKEKQYGKITITIIIKWKVPISHSQAFALSKQNHFLFTNDEKTFYGNKIVGDIKVYRR